MKINRIKATQIEMTDAIREAVESELAALDPMIAQYGEAASADVEVGRTTHHHHKGEVFRAEVNLQVPGKLLRAEDENEDLYTAIKNVAGTLHRELDKHNKA